MNQHRSSDPGDADFRPERIVRQWRAVIVGIAAAGAFVGSVLMTIKTKTESLGRETETRVQAQLSRMNFTIIEMNDNLLRSEEERHSQLRALHKDTQALLRSRGSCSEEKAEDRHAEILDILNQKKKQR